MFGSQGKPINRNHILQTPYVHKQKSDFGTLRLATAELQNLQKALRT